MSVPIKHGDLPEWLRQIAIEVNKILRGKTENSGSFTLSASTTTTNVDDSRVGINSKIIITPTSSAAAAEYGTIYVSNVTKEQFTVTHSSTADTDKTFDYILVG